MLRGSQRAPPAGEGGASSMLRGSQRAPPANGTQRSPPVPLQGQVRTVTALGVQRVLLLSLVLLRILRLLALADVGDSP